MEKFCRLEDYRRPAHFELELLQEHPGCFLVIAARNGWGSDYMGLAAKNGISDPNVIYPGQVIYL